MQFCCKETEKKCCFFIITWKLFDIGACDLRLTELYSVGVS